MIETPRILVFAGSLRKGSYNKMLSRIAACGAEQAGAEVTWIDLAEFPMPFMDQDIEDASGIPAHGKRLKALLESHHGFIIACPEYNASITGVLKNAIDWASRVENAQEPSGVAFKGKVCALVSASIGGLGGTRGLVHARAVLGNLGVLALPGQVSIPFATKAFNEAGGLVDDNKRVQVEALAHELVDLARRLN